MEASAAILAPRRARRPLARPGGRELAGAVADIGVLLPIAVALIVENGLSPTAVLLVPGVLYLVAAATYRLPVPVQPLKAFGAIAIARGLGADEIAAGALLMGALFALLAASGLLDAVARTFPRPLIRGVQLTVGLLFVKIAWGLVDDPPRAFHHLGLSTPAALGLTLAGLAFLLAFRRHAGALALVGLGVVLAALNASGAPALGPSALHVPHLDWAVLGTALTALVLPQAPLSFANSCLATADAARRYFGAAAARVRPGRLALTLGAADLLAGAVSGMPVCHGAGGMTAHVRFGARTAAAPAFMGGVLVLLAVGLGAGLTGLLEAFPLPVLAALLSAAGLLHIALLRDLRGAREWGLALLVGLLGFLVNLALALAVGLALWWLPRALARSRA